MDFKIKMDFNDQVEDVFRALVNEDETFRNYLKAVYPEQTVEGSFAMDDAMASLAIRAKAVNYAKDVADAQLETILTALKVVLRRFKLSRKQRRLEFDIENKPLHNDWQHGSHIDSMPTQPDIGENISPPVDLDKRGTQGN